MTFHEQFKRLLKHQNKSQLAHHIGVTRDSVTKWSNGTNVPNVKNLVKVCKYLYKDKWTLLYLELSILLAEQ
jgi:transcriptional regulator with XRE-family HTH domain